MTLAILFESVGAGEWLVLLAVVLIVVGPKRLPATARKFGQHYSKFRRAAESFKRQLLEMDSELTNAVRDVQNEVDAATKEVSEDLSGLNGAPDPEEYGGYADYGDYGEYDPAASAQQEQETKSGLKITVSPLPTADDAKKAGA